MGIASIRMISNKRSVVAGGGERGTLRHGETDVEERIDLTRGDIDTWTRTHRNMHARSTQHLDITAASMTRHAHAHAPPAHHDSGQ